MAPKIEFRDRSSGQRGSNGDALKGPGLSCAREGRRRSLDRFFENHFWFMFSQSKLKCLPSRFQHRHLDWGLAEKHRYFHFITIPYDSMQFRVLSKVHSWFKTSLTTMQKQSRVPVNSSCAEIIGLRNAYPNWMVWALNTYEMILFP